MKKLNRLIEADPTKLKNARLRRLKIQRLKLKYTCEEESKINDRGDDDKEVEINNKGRKIHESMQISLSLTTSSEDRSILSYGWVSLIGRRREMEDAVSVEVGNECDFFGVYDGHGGAQVAAACRERFYRLVAEEVVERGGGEVAGNAAVRTVGSTAVVAVVGKDEVVVANCGDSRAVMGRGGQAFALSHDHKPDRPDELMRIEAAGGRVINWNGQRVLGVLGTSRSIGDQYLRPYVISKPEVTVTKRTNKDEFLILASDGLWDVISNEDACELVRKCLSRRARRNNNNSPELRQNQSPAGEAAAVLADLAMAKGSRDNTSVIVVELRRSQ